MQTLFTVEELSKVIKKKPATIYKDLIREPRRLPPAIYLGGLSRPFFIYVDDFVMGKEIPQEFYDRGDELRKIKQANRYARKIEKTSHEPKKRGRPSHASRPKCN